MNCQIFTIYMWILFQANPFQVQSQSVDVDVLRDIVFVRAEGLALAELIEKNTKDKSILEFCRQIKSYYTQTQPAFVEVCTGRNLQLRQDDFDRLWSELESGIKNNCRAKDEWYLRLCEANMDKSIHIYSKIVREREWEDIAYFSFKALPNLFNLKNELGKLKKQRSHSIR